MLPYEFKRPGNNRIFNYRSCPQKSREQIREQAANTVYVASRSEFEEIKPIIKANCEAAMPANTTLICELAEEEMRVEFEVTAKI